MASADLDKNTYIIPSKASYFTPPDLDKNPDDPAYPFATSCQHGPFLAKSAYINPSTRRTSFRPFGTKVIHSAHAGIRPNGLKTYITAACAVDRSGPAVERSVQNVDHSVQHRISGAETTCKPWDQLRNPEIKPFFLKLLLKPYKHLKRLRLFNIFVFEESEELEGKGA